MKSGAHLALVLRYRGLDARDTQGRDVLATKTIVKGRSLGNATHK
jgi:hypothetical protein